MVLFQDGDAFIEGGLEESSGGVADNDPEDLMILEL
jgi:hypothetical protein